MQESRAYRRVIASAPDARPSADLVAPTALAPRSWPLGAVAPSVQAPTASRYSRPSIQASRHTTAMAPSGSFPPVVAVEAVAQRFPLSRAPRVLVGFER